MKIPKTVAAIAAFSLGAISANAAIIAATNFDGRVLTSGTTATGASLAWTTNGIANPGNMVALKGGVAESLWNSTTLTQNMFAPNRNTGNENTFWTTDVSLAVSSGSAVTLTDVSFNYWAINSSGAANNSRTSDFTLSLINPSGVALAAVNITDSFFNTSSPLVTATFTSPMALSDSGTYTLRIKGGDFLGVDNNGTHTAIDNLSINGTVAVPEPSAALLGGLGLLALLRRRRR